MRRAFFTLAIFALSASVSYACTGQTGHPIFDIPFAGEEDEMGEEISPGWLANRDAGIEGGSLVLRPNTEGLQQNNLRVTSTNIETNAGDGDYCAEFILPIQPAPDNRVGFGIVFFRADEANFYDLMAFSDGSVELWKMAAGKKTALFKAKAAAPGLKREPNAINTLRVTTTNGDKVRLMLNGATVGEVDVKRELPGNQLRFGVSAELAKATDVNPAVIVKSFVVTESQP